MALNITNILDAVVSHALATGHFYTVNQHESKKSPSSGLSASVWVERITPIKTSGLANTSIRLELTVRIYSSTTGTPYDDIDPDLTRAMDDLLGAYVSDFELGGNVRHVDVFGAYGHPLDSRAGYLNLDGREFRVFSITLPLVCDDLWTQSP
jgi:hypothetical protein